MCNSVGEISSDRALTNNGISGRLTLLFDREETEKRISSVQLHGLQQVVEALRY